MNRVTGTLKPPAALLIAAADIGAAMRRYPYAVRKAVAFAGLLENGVLDVHMPDGQKMRFGGRGAGPHADMIIKDFAFAKRLASGGDLGIAEAYLNGEWETPDLTNFLAVFVANQPILTKMLADKPLVRMLQMVGHWLNRNTRTGSRRNIHAHYDLGNSFYSAWLDPGMTYSAALFENGNTDLAVAQEAKFRALAADIGLQGSHHLLEIGCGWGGFAEFAAKTTGCQVTALTISKAQHDFAIERIFRAGLNEKVSIKMQDYRDETGVFDRVASIEMFEAVGEAYWPAYFAQLRDRLRPQGVAGIQSITIQESIFKNYRREMDFIRRYIFPGGMLPTQTILREMGTRHGFKLAGERAFGHDYATTLAQWRERFKSAWPLLTKQGFDEKFKRMWEYYLCYCEAGFTMGSIDVRQMVFNKL